jgi:hypothetical protein
MLRFIRFAAIVGMFLALADFCLAFQGCGHFFSDFRHEHTSKAFAEAVQHLVSKLYSPSIWFAYGGFLYLLANLASQRLHQTATKKEGLDILDGNLHSTQSGVDSLAG